MCTVQKSYFKCQVGANPNSVTEGCFHSTRMLTIGRLFSPVRYGYNVTKYNTNEHTLKGFSINVKREMFTCENCPYKTYDKVADKISVSR